MKRMIFCLGFIVAALTFQLVTTAPALADVFEVSGQITPTQDLSDVYLITSNMGPTPIFGSAFLSFSEIATQISANTTARFDFIFPISNGVSNAPLTFYTVMGLYGPGQVTVAMNTNITTSILGKAWPNAFVGSGQTESDVAWYLGNDPSLYNYAPAAPFDLYGTFILSDYWAPLGSPADLVSFSNAALAGFVQVNEGSSNPVPEPCTMLLFGSGLVGLAAYKRKLSKN